MTHILIRLKSFAPLARHDYEQVSRSDPFALEMLLSQDVFRPVEPNLQIDKQAEDDRDVPADQWFSQPQYLQTSHQQIRATTSNQMQMFSDDSFHGKSTLGDSQEQRKETRTHTISTQASEPAQESARKGPTVPKTSAGTSWALQPLGQSGDVQGSSSSIQRQGSQEMHAEMALDRMFKSKLDQNGSKLDTHSTRASARQTLLATTAAPGGADLASRFRREHAIAAKAMDTNDLSRINDQAAMQSRQGRKQQSRIQLPSTGAPSISSDSERPYITQSASVSSNRTKKLLPSSIVEASMLRQQTSRSGAGAKRARDSIPLDRGSHPQAGVQLASAGNFEAGITLSNAKIVDPQPNYDSEAAETRRQTKRARASSLGGGQGRGGRASRSTGGRSLLPSPSHSVSNENELQARIHRQPQAGFAASGWASSVKQSRATTSVHARFELVDFSAAGAPLDPEDEPLMLSLESTRVVSLSTALKCIGESSMLVFRVLGRPTSADGVCHVAIAAIPRDWSPDASDVTHAVIQWVRQSRFFLFPMREEFDPDPGSDPDAAPTADLNSQISGAGGTAADSAYRQDAEALDEYCCKLLRGGHADSSNGGGNDTGASQAAQVGKFPVNARWATIARILQVPGVPKVCNSAATNLHALLQAIPGSATCLTCLADVTTAAYTLHTDAVVKGIQEVTKVSVAVRTPAVQGLPISSLWQMAGGKPCPEHMYLPASAARAAQGVVGQEGGGKPTLWGFLCRLAHLYCLFERQLIARGQLQVFFFQEMSLTPVLARLEVAGVPFIPAVIEAYDKHLKQRQAELETEAHACLGRQFQISSNKDVAAILFDELGLTHDERQRAQKESGPKTKIHRSTREEVLQQLQAQHPLPGLILRWRKVAKSINTFMQFGGKAIAPALPVLLPARQLRTDCDASSGLGSQSSQPITLQSLSMSAATGRPRDPHNDSISYRDYWAAASDSAHIGIHTLHAQMTQVCTGTGRLSSRYPNLQNLPKQSNAVNRYAAGSAAAGSKPSDSSEDAGADDIEHLGSFRSALVASGPGRALLAADYGQIEMRILAHICQDRNLLRLFEAPSSPGPASSQGSRTGPSLSQAGIASRGTDIYAAVAGMVFGKHASDVTQPERGMAKTVTLGMIYGNGVEDAARKLGTSASAIRDVRQRLFRHFPGIQRFMESARQFARRHSFVLTLANRRRYLANIQGGSGAGLRSEAERRAVNTVIQGSAADLIKVCMILVERAVDAAAERTIGSPVGCSSGGLDPTGSKRQPIDGFLLGGVDPETIAALARSQVILQVHDELVLECPSDEDSLLRVAAYLKRCMAKLVPAALAGLGRPAIGRDAVGPLIRCGFVPRPGIAVEIPSAVQGVSKGRRGDTNVALSRSSTTESALGATGQSSGIEEGVQRGGGAIGAAAIDALHGGAALRPLGAPPLTGNSAAGVGSQSEHRPLRPMLGSVPVPKQVLGGEQLLGAQVRLRVPLTVKVSTGPSFGAMEEMDID